FSGAGAVRLGSYFHQLRPIASALSTEQISSRMRTVSNSTLASETRMSPAITSPLSRTRSRISSRLAVPETVGTLCINISGKYGRDRGQEESHALHVTASYLACCKLSPLPTVFCRPARKSARWRGQLVFVRCRAAQKGLAAA